MQLKCGPESGNCEGWYAVTIVYHGLAVQGYIQVMVLHNIFPRDW